MLFAACYVVAGSRVHIPGIRGRCRVFAVRCKDLIWVCKCRIGLARRWWLRGSSSLRFCLFGLFPMPAILLYMPWLLAIEAYTCFRLFPSLLARCGHCCTSLRGLLGILTTQFFVP